MSDIPSDLEGLRRRIDEIDDRLQDLLVERIQIVSNVAAHKRSNRSVAAHQPAREAEIIRRLIERNQGAFPPAALVRMWRELLAATVRLQGAFTVAVYAAPEAQGFWDIARDHYGSHTPMLPYRTTSQVISAVTDGQAAVGVLPMPPEDDPDPWWRHLLSLIATENAPSISRGRIVSTLSRLGLASTFTASCEHAEGANTLIEIDAFVPSGDPRLDRFRAQLGPALYRVLRFGGYAVPLSPSVLVTPRTAGPAPAAAGATAAAKV